MSIFTSPPDDWAANTVCDEDRFNLEIRDKFNNIDTKFPTGIIVMWSGSIVSIPAGWYLCNGANGTPDLRDKFVVGAGSTYNPAATGGSLTTSTPSLHSGFAPAGGDNAAEDNHTHTFIPPYYALAYIMKA